MHSLKFLIQTVLATFALADLSSLARAQNITPPQTHPRQPTAIDITDNADVSSHVTSEVLAGVALFSSNSTYDLVSTHVRLPDIPPPDNASLSAAYTWSGIDGIGCGVAALQAGLRLIAVEGHALYDAWYRWYPGPMVVIEGLSLQPGNDLQFILLLANATAGFVTVINESSGESNFTTVSGPPLCQQSVGWMLERATSSEGLLPLPDFGSLNYTMAFASTVNGSIVDPSSPFVTVYDIVQDGVAVTETLLGFENATIKHVTQY